MRYAYPAPRTGTAQDLMRVITHSYEERLEREETRLPIKGELGRRLVEPPARLIGMALGAAMELIPADWTVAFHDKLYGTLSAGKNYPFDPERPELVRAAALAAVLEAESGLAPALLALISHPPVMGDLAHLNFELVRHSTLALRRVRARPCRPRLVVAVDPFALDTTSIVEEGLYAGYMGSFHLGIDRLALGRGHPGTFLTPQARWDRMPLRLFRTLAEGGEVGMVLSGGVPTTGRVLYGVREWARRARGLAPRRGDPARVLKDLRAEPGFARFEKNAAAGMALPRGAWRLMEARLMASAAGVFGAEPIEDAARATLAVLSVPEAARPGLLADLHRDMTRETPARRRLFRLLAGRVAARRPLVVVPVVHHTEPLGVSIGEAWGLVSEGRGRVRARRADRETTEIVAIEDFAEKFVGDNFA